MIKAAPRLMIAGTGSGQGKTTVSLAILQALKERGLSAGAYKCGPDYIDPLFHGRVIGARSGNLDLFLTDEKTMLDHFAESARDLNVIEGVMGYYDGLTADCDEASSFAIARALNAPAVLIVNAKGMALSAAAIVKGFLSLREDHGICGVILNQVSQERYPSLKRAIEKECGVRVYGYLPHLKGAELKSRHLGLVTAEEVKDLRGKLSLCAEQAERSIDLDGLIALMRQCPEVEALEAPEKRLGEVRIAVAMDEAFCFYYRENMSLLEKLGARLIPFSPLRGSALPPCDGLYMGGGYPELYAEALSQNENMRISIREAVSSGLPTVAECGGFMYLTEHIGAFEMVSLLPGGCENEGRLVRFGYVTLKSEKESLLFGAGDTIRGHEFHYYEADHPGDALSAVKPSGKTWRCGHLSKALYAGFPHLSFASNPRAAERFVTACLERKKQHAPFGH